jgi:CcmD family protein
MRTILLALFLGVFAPVPLSATPVASAVRPLVISMSQELTTGESELASQTVEQRNNRAYWHVFMAFAAAWLLLLLYAVTIGRRFGKLEEDVRQLRRG